MSRTLRIHAPRLYPKQHAAIFDSARHSIIEASTKAGKTVGCIVWQIDQNFRRRGEHWWVAPIYNQARIAFKRAKKMLPKAAVRSINASRMEITFVNGSVWTFKSADDPDGLYGEDVQSVVIDEASRCHADVWTAIRSVLTATRGRSRIIGNVKGRKTWHYKLARRAAAGAPGFAYHKLTAWDAVEGGAVAREEIEEAQRDLPERVFRELYLAEATEDGSNPFGHDKIKLAELADVIAGPVVCWGVDLAKKRDWTVLVGLNADGHACEMHRFQRPWKTTIRDIRFIVRDTPALVDATGVGDPVLEELQAGGRSNFEGFVFTARSKQELLESLEMDFAQERFRFPAEFSVMRQELEDFEYTHTRTGVRYSAPEGLHDDVVCATALARRKFKARPDIWW